VPAASRVDDAAVFDPSQAASHVQNLVQPLWQGQPAAVFRPLAQMLLPLTEPFSFIRTIPPKPQPTTGTVTRRGLITGFLAEEETPDPCLEEVMIERPLHPALQYGLTTALLQAVAAVNRESVAALVAREYEETLTETAVPLQITLDDETIQTARTILITHVASLGYTTSKNNHKAMLGANGERLQRHVREVAAWLPTVDDSFQPALHLDLRDSFRELFDNDEGKILGALVGLDQAAKPYILHIQNPVWQDSCEEQLKSLEKLKGYLAFRRIKLKLVADAWVDSLADVTDFANSKVCHMVHVELPRLGNLEAGITAVRHLKSQNQSIILSGEDRPLTTHIALATQPTILSGSPQLHYNEMQKFLQK
jgi:methylaspartate ammonia-lyase